MSSSQSNYRDALCATHGAFTSRRYTTVRGDFWSDCESCTREHEKAQTRIRASGLEGRFLEATFDSFVATTQQQRQVLDACREWVAELRTNSWRPLWLIGPPGTGKTHLLSAITRATIVSRQATACAAAAREIVRTLRDTWRRGSDRSEESVIDGYIAPAVLAIDELGVGFGSEAEAVQLLDVVDGRYTRRRHVVVASNLNRPGLQKALGERIVDRLAENATVLVCDWPSFRTSGGVR